MKTGRNIGDKIMVETVGGRIEPAKVDSRFYDEMHDRWLYGVWFESGEFDGPITETRIKAW